MEKQEHAEGILADVAFMACVGMKPVVVHGGGKAITRTMEKHGLESNFLKGLRVTCEKTIRIVEKVIKGEVNPGIVVGLEQVGAKAHGIQGEEVFQAVKKTSWSSSAMRRTWPAPPGTLS